MLDHFRFACHPPHQLPAVLLRWRVSALYNRSPRMVKKIMIVIGVIIVWEGRQVILPAIETGVSYVVSTGSSLLQSV